MGEIPVVDTSSAPRFSKAWWLATFDRALRTALQLIASVILGDAAFNVLQADWQTILGGAITGAVLSIANSIITKPPEVGGPNLATGGHS